MGRTRLATGAAGRSSDYSQGIEADLIADVRRFNRTVTERVGALHDRYLARDRSLSESRLLWEIGAGGTDGCEVRAVRTRSASTPAT